MSIKDKQAHQPSLTEGDRALNLFTDRHEFTRLFAECLHEPTQEKILFFYGAGGNGKTLLLKYLQQKCCKRLPPKQWQQVKGLSDGELAQIMERAKPLENCELVPAALIDFAQTRVNERPQDPFYGLLLLRKQLAEAVTQAKLYRLKFPRYDFACVWYLHQKGKSAQEIKALFPLTEAAGAITALIDAVSQTTVGAISKAVFDFFGKEWGKQLTLYLSRTGLTQEQVKAICQKDLNTELIDELPGWFAEDLNVAMEQPQAPERIVLLFDTHEAFWGHERGLPKERHFYRDEWLRQLLRGLNLEAGIVVAVAGRDLPRWQEAKAVKPGTDIPPEYVNLQRVGNLSAADGLIYLEREPIRITGELAKAVMNYAQVSAGEVHPLYLGLGADVVMQARSQGISLSAADFVSLPEAHEKAAVLIERLLRYVSESVRNGIYALSACRSFDLNLYRLLAEALNFPPYDADFRLLTGFSFVTNSPVVTAGGQPGGGYRMHNLLRRLNDERGEEKTQAAHQVLGQHYWSQEQVAEAIFHLNRLDWQSGVQRWVQAFDEALKLGRYERCRELLEVRSDLVVRDDFHLGWISQSEGEYFQRLARYKAAKQEYGEAIVAYEDALAKAPDSIEVLNNKGNALQSLGALQAGLAEHREALTCYEQAIAAYEDALAKAPDSIEVLNNKGLTLQRLGDLQAGLAEHREARRSYEQAIDAFGAALTHAPDSINVLNNKGLTLQRLGALQAGLAEHGEARRSYKQAIGVYDAALALVPDSIEVLNNKGLTLHSLGALQAGLAQYREALTCYEQAIVAYEDALTHAPDSINALNNKGLTLARVGALQAVLAQHGEAQRSYEQAIDVYAAALAHAPDDIYSLNNKGNTLQGLGALQAVLSEHGKALRSYEEAIGVYEDALALAPDSTEMLNNKGNTLQRLGALQAVLAKHGEARRRYEQAMAAYAAALALAPDYISALNNKGLSLVRLGALQARLSQHREALRSYEEAIGVYEDALALAPVSIEVLSNKGLVLQRVGDLQVGLAQHREAQRSYEQAIEVYDSALAKAPDDIEVLNNQGNTLARLGDLQASLAQHGKAQTSYEQAIEVYEDALAKAPNSINAVNNKGFILQRLGDLLLTAFQKEKIIHGREYLLQSLLVLSRSIELAPDDDLIRKRRDQIQAYLINSITEQF